MKQVGEGKGMGRGQQSQFEAWGELHSDAWIRNVHRGTQAVAKENVSRADGIHKPYNGIISKKKQTDFSGVVIFLATGRLAAFRCRSRHSYESKYAALLPCILPSVWGGGGGGGGGSSVCNFISTR